MARTHPTQMLSDVVAELRGVNERLDTLLARSAPQVTPAPAEPTAEPAPVRLEEPVRPSLESSLDELKAAAVAATESPRDVVSEAVDQAGTCQATTKRGNTCGRPLPCPISAHQG